MRETTGAQPHEPRERRETTMSNDNSKPAEPVRLTKIGDRRWTTGDLCITVTLTITSHPPAVRGLDSVKVRRYRATR